MTPLLALVPLLLVACSSAQASDERGVEPVDAPANGAPRPPVAPPADEVDASTRTVVLRSGTQATFGAVRVAAGNIWEADYAPAGEAPRRGLTAQLWIQVRGERRTHVRVHPGFVFTAGSRGFTVVSVEADSVRLRTDRHGS
jgi:hypothetical protein